MSLSAHTEKNTNSADGGTSYETESNTETKELNSSGEAEPAEQSEELDSEPDSSYYSVNKFNFLFYFVYKMKYMDEGSEAHPAED